LKEFFADIVQFFHAHSTPLLAHRIIKIGLSSESLRTLIAALASCSTVTHLSIDYVSIASPLPSTIASDGAAASAPVSGDDEHASVEPWADLFSAASPLQSVSLRGNQLTDAVRDFYVS
jgi:hypothetical protein